MSVKILNDFFKEFGHLDIDKKFNVLNEYKKVYMIKSNSEPSEDRLCWIYN